MSTPDVKALIGEVAARHGVTLKPDDPAFVLVTLNQLMLEQAVAALDEHAVRIAAEFRQNMDRLETRAGKFFGGEVRKAALELRQSICKNADSESTAPKPVHLVWRERSLVLCQWAATGLVAAVVLFVLGFFTGRMGN